VIADANFPIVRMKTPSLYPLIGLVGYDDLTICRERKLFCLDHFAILLGEYALALSNAILTPIIQRGFLSVERRWL